MMTPRASGRSRAFRAISIVRSNPTFVARPISLFSRKGHPMTVTPAKLEANRRNARKSTGPRTKAGKDRAKRNGISHGVFCNDIVLSDESQQDFDNLRAGFLLQLRPADVIELMLVDRIASASWKLRRMNRVEALTIEASARRDAEELDEAREEEGAPISPTLTQARMMLDRDSVALERLARHAQRLELSINRSLKELHEMRKRTQSPSGSPEAEALFAPEVIDGDDDDLDAGTDESEPIDQPTDEAFDEHDVEDLEAAEPSSQIGRSDDLPILAPEGSQREDTFLTSSRRAAPNPHHQPLAPSRATTNNQSPSECQST